MITITKRFTFEASHQLPFYIGDCHRLHGHSYKMEVTVCGEIEMNKTRSDYGMVMDFKELKKIVEENIIKKVDHNHLNNLFDNPTAEIMVGQFGLTLKEKLPSHIKLVSIRLWETESSYAEYINGGI